MKAIFLYWHADFLTSLLLLLLAICYFALWKFRLHRVQVLFVFAILLLALCLISPLHTLSAHYLFSAHMTVHVILLLIVAPLLVMSLPQIPCRNSYVSSLFLRVICGWAGSVVSVLCGSGTSRQYLTA